MIGPRKRNALSVEAGKLRERVTFQRKAATGQVPPSDQTDPFGNPIDEMGNSTGTFTDLFSVLADIRETRGKEKVESGAVEASRTATMRVQYSSATASLTPADRVIARGEIWNIRSGPVRVGATPRLLEFLCETGVAQ